MEYRCTRRELFNNLQEEKGGRQIQKNSLVKHIATKVGVQASHDKFKLIEKQVSRFCSELFRRLDKSNRIIDRFLKNNEEWLDREFVCDVNVVKTPFGKRGRPQTDFGESSTRSKRRKTETLRKSAESAESLAFAAKMKHRESGNVEHAKLLDEMEKSPTRPSKIRSWTIASTSSSSSVMRSYNDDEALAIFLEADLTTHQYKVMRQGAKDLNADIYPSYKRILNAKKTCYPESLLVTESVAEVKLQDLLNHTASRIIMSQEPLFVRMKYDKISMTLISKWGCDGSSGHSLYKQRAEEGFSDSDIFFTSMVPVQLFCVDENGEKSVLWQNPSPSSTLYCRPIKIQFVKESTILTKKEVAHVEEQISALSPTNIKMFGKEFEINHDMLLTMIDGKICNAITSTLSTQRCYICGATPKDMNKLDLIEKKIC